jgi:hypothetical protein
MIFMKKDLMESVSVEIKEHTAASVWRAGFKRHVQFICNSHTTTLCAHPTSPGIVLAPSKTAKYNCLLMRTKCKLQKLLQAPARNR